jgi:transcriptional regulator with XRE-family HTH domain
MPVKSTPSELAQDLRTRRERLGWSQAKLAAKAGTTQQTIDRIENGQTTHSRSLPKISAALDIAETNVVLTSDRLRGLRTETAG